MRGQGKGAAIGLLVTALLLLGAGPGQAGDPPLGGARISAVEGEVLVQMPEGGGGRAAPLHMPLLPGDRLQVGPAGHLEILLSNGTAIRLGPGSSARLVAVPPSEPGPDAAAEVDLEAGRAMVATGEGDRTRPALLLNATGTRIQIYPRAHLQAEAVSADATEVTLRDGAATADTLGTSIPLRPGETLQASRGGALLVAGRAPDAFDRWSEARESVLAAAPPGSPYLPPPLAPHAADLDRYGQWASVPEYGDVWRPTAVPAGWAPFTAGDWVWRGDTWVWLPAEPWGWAPFHYGRWRWETRLGWYWVPPRPKLVVWCPGAVAWFRTPTHVAWVPLAPGEIYYARRPYGIWSAPVPATTVINITHIHIHKTYVNAAAPAAVAAVPAATFTGRTGGRHTIARVNLAAVAANHPVAVVTPAALAPAGAARQNIALGAPRAAMAPTAGERAAPFERAGPPPSPPAPRVASAKPPAPPSEAQEVATKLRGAAAPPPPQATPSLNLLPAGRAHGRAERLDRRGEPQPARGPSTAAWKSPPGGGPPPAAATAPPAPRAPAPAPAPRVDRPRSKEDRPQPHPSDHQVRPAPAREAPKISPAQAPTAPAAASGHLQARAQASPVPKPEGSATPARPSQVTGRRQHGEQAPPARGAGRQDRGGRAPAQPHAPSR